MMSFCPSIIYLTLVLYPFVAHSNMSKISVQPIFSRHNRRKLDELPYQVLQLRGRILEEFVLNFDWVYEKLCGSDTYQVSQ